MPLKLVSQQTAKSYFMSLPGGHCNIINHACQGSPLSALLSQCDLSNELEIVETHIASINAAGAIHTREAFLSSHSHHQSHGGGKGAASHFPLFLELPPFSRLQCQCLLTGLTIEEKFRCSGNGKKKFPLFLSILPSNRPSDFLHVSAGCTALGVFIAFCHLPDIQPWVSSHFLCLSFLICFMGIIGSLTSLSCYKNQNYVSQL